jgi:hypothetical protein
MFSARNPPDVKSGYVGSGAARQESNPKSETVYSSGTFTRVRKAKMRRINSILFALYAEIILSCGE